MFRLFFSHKLSVYHPGVYTKLNKKSLPVKHTFYYCT